MKTDVHALYLAYRDPRVPWYAKLFIASIIGYALSPIDLIPDFIPVLGYVDDFILIPAGIALAVQMIPREVLQECREKAKSEPLGKNWAAAVVVLVIWAISLYIVVRILFLGPT